MDLKKMLLGIFILLLAIYTIVFSTYANSIFLFYVSVSEILIGFVFFLLGYSYKE